MSTPPRSTVRRPLIGALLALVALALAAGTALAHAELATSDPADGAVLDVSPATITLTFTERLDPGKSSFRLFLGDDNLGVGEATGPREMTLEGLTLAPGDYLIKWTSASADDGDIERGQLTFTVEAAPASVAPSESAASSPEPSTGPSPSAAPSTAPTVAPSTGSTPVASGAPSEIPTPGPSAAPTEPASSTNDVLLPIVVGLLLVAGIGAFVLRRSRGA